MVRSEGSMPVALHLILLIDSAISSSIAIIDYCHKFYIYFLLKFYYFLCIIVNITSIIIIIMYTFAIM